MTAMRSILATFVVACLAAAGIAADKDDNKKLIVGKWEVIKADEGTAPVGTIVEFLKDGKMKMTAKKDGKEESRDGTYALDGSSLTVVSKRNDEERTIKLTIKKLSTSELMVESPDGKSVSFKKK